MKPFRDLAIAIVLALPLAFLLLRRPVLIHDAGLYTTNHCGTYDRWILWGRGRLELPNGWLGLDPEACRRHE
jgi:hypothetical protein